MSDERTDYERWTQLVDRQAEGQTLTLDEVEFCEAIETLHSLCNHERKAYAELADLGGAPNEASRALVDRALQQFEADQAARAVADVRLLRHRRVPAWLALTGTVAVGLCAVFALRASRAPRVSNNDLRSAAPSPLTRAELVYASGKVTVSGANGGAGRTLLVEGSVIETSDGAACVLIDSDINVCLAANSRMRLTAIAVPARRIELEAGKLATRLATQPEGMSLTIEAGGVASTAVGTAFAVEYAADQSVVTTVLNGKVRVGRGAEPALVSAHERAVSRTDRPGVTSVSRSDEAPSWAMLGPTVLWHDPVSATLEVRGEPAGAEAWLDDQLIGVAPLSSLIPVGEHRLAVRKGGEELAVRELHLHAGETQEVIYKASAPVVSAPVSSQAPAPTPTRVKAAVRAAKRVNPVSPVSVDVDEPAPPAAAEPPLTSAELLRRARQHLRAGRIADASQSYATLISRDGGSDEAQTALVLLGQLRLTQNDPRGALEPLNSYLRTGGSLEVEARVARIEALHALNQRSEEVTAIDEFLRRHPHTFEAKTLRARLVSQPTSP